MKNLLTATAVIEAGAGLALLALPARPALVVSLAHACEFDHAAPRITASGSVTAARHTARRGFHECSQPRDIVSRSAWFVGDNGGATQTVALLPGSPAIDRAGNSGPTTDQRGVARQDGNFDGSIVPDIGAYEYVPRHVYLPLILR